MKFPITRRSPSNEDAVGAPPRLPTQTTSAIQEQIPPDLIAARIGEMLQAKQATENGDLETDWRTVEAGIRLYLDYATKFPNAAPIEDLTPRRLEPKTARSEAAAARRETQRIYTNPQLEAITPRTSSRVLPTKNQNPGALEPLENMRKLLIPDTPLAALQVAPGSQSRNVSQMEANHPIGLDFDATSNPAMMALEESPRRTLPLMALLACLVVGSIIASASQFHTRPSSSGIPADAPKTPDAGGIEIASSSPAASLPPASSSRQGTTPAEPLGSAPKGWSSQKDYDSWKPKFEASLSDEPTRTRWANTPPHESPAKF